MGAVAVADGIARQLEEAWNSADGAAFGRPFADDADFVAIRGEMHSGEDIGAAHQQIFDTIYARSTIRYEVVQARELDDRVILAHLKSALNAPSGPLAGEHGALATVVLVREGDGYVIAAFQNTLITG